LCLVSCAERKLDYACPAKEMYTRSTNFRMMRRCAEALARDWFIISGKFGLLQPDQRIEPYQYKLTRSDANFTAKVRRQSKNLRAGGRLLILASDLYVEMLPDDFLNKFDSIDTPLSGLNVLWQRSWLSKALKQVNAEAVA
jgi:hypothetical protein